MLKRSMLLISCALLAACGNDTTGALIVADTGGTVTSSAADVVIPAASLGEDTEVMISVGEVADIPALENARVILDLQPRGTALETPASVTIYGSEIGAGDGERVEVFQLLDGWLPVEHEVGSGGDVTVSITRFQPIGVTVSEGPSGGTIEGTISWGSGEPAGGAPIELWQGDSMITMVTSDDAGAFRFTDLQSGTYSLRVNYECQIDQSVGVAEGATETVQLTLCGG